MITERIDTCRDAIRSALSIESKLAVFSSLRWLTASADPAIGDPGCKLLAS